MHVLINIVAFKIGWVATIFGAANEFPLLGPAVIMIAILVHLVATKEPAQELFLVFLAGVIGASFDSLFVAAGWLSYPNGTVVSGLAPYWIIALWMLFATTMNLAFSWLKSRMRLAALLGAIFGPVSYFFGAQAGAVVINDFSAAMIGLSIAWAISFPLLLELTNQLDDAGSATTEVEA